MFRFLFISAMFLLVVLFVPQKPAVAMLNNSKHDFSYLGQAPCSYCHMVHHSIGTALRPAYQKEAPMITRVYSSATMKHKPKLATINYSDAPLCMTCHDGMNVNVLNMPVITGLVVGKSVDLNQSGTSLSDDHPIGFDFDPLSDPNKYNVPTKTHPGYGASKKEVWCCTCHNPHNNQYGAFLVASNEGSAICLDCHKK